jgi:glycerol-3-phosphate dehydrogenase
MVAHAAPQAADHPGGHAVPDAVDVIIIGGGANGTGLARDLSLRGVRVLLAEKGDLGRGASGASSGMIHGGPRYLLDDVETTKHSCEDSGYIQAIAPHLCFRIPFLMPVPKANPFGPLGLLLHDVFFDVYDRYTPLKNGIPHAKLTPEQMRATEPGLVGDYLGGVTLDEWGIDVGRLCLLNALDAEAHGAHIATYTTVTAIDRDLDGRIVGAQIRPEGQAQSRSVRAPVVVNCAGAWAEAMAKLPPKTGAALAANSAQLRPGKGVHLIYEKRVSNFAVITSAKDGRQIFVMPYLNETWIGTTDDDYYGDLDDLWATEDEIQYLREAGEAVLPGLKAQRLIGTRVGVRNTIYGWGQLEDSLSRRYEIVDHAHEGAPGFYSLVGGKLASYRIQAQQTADAVCRRLGVTATCETQKRPLPGGANLPTVDELVRAYKIDALVARRLIARHGSIAPKVLDLGLESPGGLEVLDPYEPTLACEVRWAVRHEKVTHLGDLMTRCRVAMGADMGMAGGLLAAQIFAEERGLDVQTERAELMDLLARRWRSARPILEGPQLAQMELFMEQFSGNWQLPHLRAARSGMPGKQALHG